MTTVHRRFCGAFGLGCLLFLSTSIATAQTPEERAGARAAARRGVEAYDSGSFAEALDLFTRAEKLVHAPTHLLYIARANVKLYRLVSAQEAYQQLTRETLAANASQPFRDAQQSATRELAALEARIPMVTITVSGSKADQVTVVMDGHAVPSALVGIPHPVDPGQHQFQAAAPGYASPKADKSLREGEQLSVDLVLRQGAPGSLPLVAADTPASSPGSSATSNPPGKVGPVAESVKLDAGPQSSTSYRPYAYVSLGVGAVGIAAGAYFLVNYLDFRSSADDRFRACDATKSCKETGEDQKINAIDDKSRINGMASAVAFSVGGLATATGITLLLLEPSANSRTATLTQPKLNGWVGPASVGLSGQF